MKYKIADVIVDFNPKFDMLKLRAEKYKVDNREEAEYDLVLVENENRKKFKESLEISDEEAEYIFLGLDFYKALLNESGFMLHSSAVVVDDDAYLFSADSGVGKSTHTSLWLKYLKEKKPYILNDDKPAIRIFDDEIFAYGTPFSGKHDMSENKKVKVKAICFLEQSKTNFIRKMEPKETVNLFIEQTVRTLSKNEMIKFFDILEVVLKQVPIYKLYCDMSKEAVELSYETMSGNVV